MSDRRQPRLEAAQWLARLRSGRAHARERRRFERWRSAGRDNEQSYRAAVAAWDLAGDAAGDEVVLAMRQKALETLAPATRRRAYAATAACLLLGACAGLVLYLRTAAPDYGAAHPMVYETAVGQRSTISLPDGSVVELNTDTRIDVRYGPAERHILLRHGEALFMVAHDADRPFVVHANDHLITALGTAFDVRSSDAEVQVTLLEGKVTVTREGGPLGKPEVHALEPGQQLVAVPRRPVRVEQADLRRVTGWRDGLLVFTDSALDDVIDEINRYSTRKIALGSESMKALRIGGVFHAGSIAGFVSAIESAFPITGRYDGEHNVVVLEWTDREKPSQRHPERP